MDTVYNLSNLQFYVNSGHKVKYLFFWGHKESGSQVTKACFSQWYDAPFEHNGIKYLTAEHFMMAEKARLFNDAKNLQQILNATNPGEAKKLGRAVVNFDDKIWNAEREKIVVEANLLKFSQNPELKTFLLQTGDRVLVEASPVDRIWGIGMAQDDENIYNPNLWRGQNLLGFALMKTREILKSNLTNTVTT